MNLLKHEIVKLLRSPAIYGFLVACLAINAFIVFASSRNYYIDYMNEVSEITGTLYGEDYLERLQSVSETDDYGYISWRYMEVLGAAESAGNIFADGNGGREIKNALANGEIPLSDTAIKIQLWKYELLTPVIEAKAERDDGASVYFGPYTAGIHNAIFGGAGNIGIGMITAAQTCVFFILIMLWTLGFETMSGTDLVVWSTKTGRRLIQGKIIAALTIGTGFFLITYAVTYGLTFAVNDYSVVWSQNVSAQYNMVWDQHFKWLPVITWKSMTIGEYFFAGTGIALLNGIVAALIAIPFGLLIRNTYVAFCSIVGIILMHYLLVMYASQSEGTIPFIWNISMIFPLLQVISSSIWFTDGGTRMLLPHFETLYPLICMLLLCPVIIISIKKFLRKEIV
ncbi:MAG: hypothetical protein FWD44_04375 [Oscillospiraceae bacterium]|nr:hypothetical protein [Oscillospiraceae bacterium]